MVKWVLLLAMFSFAPNLLLACPLCHSDTAAEVKAGILQTSLDGLTIPALVLPFVVLAMIVSAMLVDWDAIITKKPNLTVRTPKESS